MTTSETKTAAPKNPAHDVMRTAPPVVEPPPNTPIEVPKPRSEPVQSQPEQPTSIATYIGWTVVLVLVGVGWYYQEHWWPKVAPYVGLAPKQVVKPPPPVVPVVTATVVKKDMEVFINGLGTVTAFKTVTLRSRVDGELVNVAFTEGQMVNANDLLAEIDKRQYNVQLQQAEGTLARDEATLQAAEFTLKRYQDLLLTKSIAPQQVDEQRALVQQTTGAIRSDRAMVANAKLNLDFCRITSPITGRIGLRLVDQGNIVHANDLLGLAVITQLQPISLVFTIPQDDISRVQKATLDGRELTVLAYDRNFQTKLAIGKLAAIDNQVDATTGTVRLKAIFDNQDNLLFPNQFVNARLLVDIKKDAVVVPIAAVQRGPTSNFVYVVQPDETVDLRTVVTGLSEGAEISINSGLEPGEIVVTEGLEKLKKGSAVAINTREKDDKKKDKEGSKTKESAKDNSDGAKNKGKKSETSEPKSKELDYKSTEPGTPSKTAEFQPQPPDTKPRGETGTQADKKVSP